ncbi:MAG: hypothetical protein GVY12_11545 [Bacteroidetes bacterium]|jgi:DNA-binding PadR family transcriptional regulator|nr:hypothetical protein [Bacteroidota bacterium]
MSSSDRDGLPQTSPTVSREKWEVHALRKLAKGYVLIVSRERKNANFHSPTKGYEMCAYQVAKKLVNDGLVEQTREHHLGTVYELADEVREGLKKHRKPMPKDEDDEDVAAEEDTEAILDEIPDLDDDELDLEDEENEEYTEEDER